MGHHEGLGLNAKNVKKSDEAEGDVGIGGRTSQALSRSLSRNLRKERWENGALFLYESEHRESVPEIAY